MKYVHAKVAEALVRDENAVVDHRNGSIRSIRLLTPASACALRLGPPTAPSLSTYGTRFAVREKLDSGHVVWKHHRRATDVME